MSNHTIAHIDLSALKHNLAQIKSKAPQTNILAMIKSNAYGHGAEIVAKTLESEAQAFGVIFLSEALKLKNTGIEKRIVILTGFLDQEELKNIDEFGFETVIHNFEQLEILEKTKLKKPLHVWLKIDTGMHRLGFQPKDVASVYAKLAANNMIVKPLLLMTHFSDADNIDCPKTQEQLVCFKKITANFEGSKCLANSSAIINWPNAHADFIRPGIMLYGVSPIENKTGLDFGLKPVMTLVSRVIAIHHLHKGDTIGYGGTWKCPEDMPVGIVSIGYGDGYPRSAESGTPVLINESRCQLIGRVAMDMITIDLRNAPNAKVGDKATLWGNGLPAEEIAKCAGTIPYELFCRLTSRVVFNSSIK